MEKSNNPLLSSDLNSDRLKIKQYKKTKMKKQKNGSPGWPKWLNSEIGEVTCLKSAYEFVFFFLSSLLHPNFKTRLLFFPVIKKTTFLKPYFTGARYAR